jgi:exonuclease SbcC
MRNFMPYHGEVPPFSFNGIHTACICGDNGSGKSALVDAITWAIWGRTRANSDDDLIHMVETEMAVEFDFTASDRLYRIVRRHSRPKGRKASGKSSLDLLIAGNGSFKPITGDTLRQTQKEIIEILHMDYDTFINSAFLRQGHADEFTKQQPAQRKQVLANILGFSFYDELEERAKDLAKRRQIEKLKLEGITQGIDQELAQKPELEARLDEAQQELLQLEQLTKKQQARLDNLRREKEVLGSKRLQLAQLEEHMGKTEQDLKRWQDQTNQCRQRIGEYQELISKRDKIEEGYRRLSETRKLNEELGQKLKTLTKTKDRKSQLEKVIQEAQGGLLRKHAVVESRVNEWQASSQKLPQLITDRQQLEYQQQQSFQKEQRLKEKQRQSQELRSAIYELECDKVRLHQGIKDIVEKLALLESKSAARCPLCETGLSRQGLNVIKAKYTDERESKMKSLEVKEAAQSSRKLELETLEKEVVDLEKGLNKELTALQDKVGRLAREVSDAEAAKAKLKEVKAELSEIENQLAGKSFATHEQKALVELEEELATLGYDSTRHEQIARQLIDLERYEMPKRRLEEAERQMGWQEVEVAKAEEAAQELSRRLEAGRQKAQALAREQAGLPRLENDLMQAETEYQGAIRKQKQSQESAGSLKGKLEQLQKQEKKRQQMADRLDQAATEEKAYRDLAQAFGKKGIQAWLIELALPEIEIEANRLLGRMTDNRMHVNIEAQRQTKKGDLVETMDIVISDELGARNYEMFSGGEAFRIDFALRIALSKLLAKRAGAPLPTLIIDEGFGTQDSTGIEKLKEAINSIQDDFEKIIVITHIEELKDAFPVRINVIKTPESSTLEIS